MGDNGILFALSAMSDSSYERNLGVFLYVVVRYNIFIQKSFIMINAIVPVTPNSNASP